MNKEILKSILEEKIVSIDVFKARVDALRFQLVRNWCLCKWCQIYNSECESFSHWIAELEACVDNIKCLKIKNGIDRRKTLIKMLVDDYDYDDANMIERIIRGEFRSENIVDNFQKATVSIAFADCVNDLIDVMSIDSLSTIEYLQNTFK